MRKNPNLVLRGPIWYLRIAVPKSLQAIRAQQGIRSSKEVWKSLGTGDLRAAKAQLTQVKAEVCRAFEAEERRFLQRPVPTLAQIQEVAGDFGQLVRTSLANERLLELPTAPEVERALAQREEVTMALASASGAEEMALTVRDSNLDYVIFAAEDQQEARQALRGRLADELLAMDYRSVSPFIEEAARTRGYRVDPEGVPARQLGHLLLKAWIAELDRADGAFLDLDEPMRDQGEALKAWQSPGRVVTDPKAEVRETLPNPVPTPQGAGDIRNLFQTYLRERFPKIAKNKLQDYTRTIEQFVEVAGARDVAVYRKVDVTAYKAALLTLPVNAGKDYPGKAMQEIAKLAPATAKRLAPKTVKSRLSILSSFGRWLSENVDGVNAANFRTTAPVAKKPETPVREFSDDDVGHILLYPAFTGCLSERNQGVPGTHLIRDYRYWLPLLAAYSGCRLNELTQLRLDDVQELDGIWTLRITDAGEGQSLKTKASERLVPVHSRLIRLGFVEYVQKLKAQGQQVLFWDVPVSRSGRRSEAAGKWFRKLLVRCGVGGSRGGIHRFRHTVVQKLRDAGHSDTEIALIVGHETGSAQMTAGYGSSRQMLLKHRKQVIDAVRYTWAESGDLPDA